MVVAKRVLRIDGADTAEGVEITLFAPVQREGGWSCRYEIAWPEAPRAGDGWGSDAMQAIHMTLQRIGIDLYMSEHHAAGRLR